jgi:hypothetical protein
VVNHEKDQCLLELFTSQWPQLRLSVLGPESFHCSTHSALRMGHSAYLHPLPTHDVPGHLEPYRKPLDTWEDMERRSYTCIWEGGSGDTKAGDAPSLEGLRQALSPWGERDPHFHLSARQAGQAEKAPRFAAL